MSVSSRPVAVFDLDDTLTRGDSFALFLRWMLFRQRWRAALAWSIAPVAWPALLFRATRRKAVAAFLWLASVGMSERQFTALARQFATTHADGRIPVALQRLHQHLADGHRVVIVTACADPLATAICQELGLSGVEVIAARLRPGRCSGMRPSVGCRGEQKVRRLREAGVVLPVDFAYTDSAVDLPLLHVAQQRFIVAPSPGDLSRIRAALPVSLTVLDHAGQGPGPE